MCVCVYVRIVRMQVYARVCVCVNARMHVSKLVCICLSTHVCDRAAMVRVSLGVGRLGQGQPQ